MNGGRQNAASKATRGFATVDEKGVKKKQYRLLKASFQYVLNASDGNYFLSRPHQATIFLDPNKTVSFWLKINKRRGL